MEEVIRILSEVTTFSYIINQNPSDEDYEVYIVEENIMDSTFNDDNPLGFLAIKYLKDSLEILEIQLSSDISIDILVTFMKATPNLTHLFSEIRIELENNVYLADEMVRYYYEHCFPIYKPYQFLPNQKSKCKQYKIDLLQLPFLKPEEFLELKYGKYIVAPKSLYFINRKTVPIHLMCQREPDHPLFRLLPATSFYKRSKRPITSMSLLRQNKFKVIDLTKVKQGYYTGRPININNQIYIPVIRYSYGMRRGCYFDNVDNQTYVGTFYYWEPDSNVFLCLGEKDKVEFYESKMDCALQIIKVLEKFIGFQLRNNYQTNISDLRKNVYQKIQEQQDLLDECYKWIKKILEDMYKEFIKYFEKENEELLVKCTSLDMISYPYHPFLKSHMISDPLGGGDIKYIFMSDILNIYQGVPSFKTPIKTNYESSLSNKYMNELFYAAEDELDQVITKILSVLGIDAVILGKMAGNNRIVTEILDTRTREVSLDNLFWEIQ